MKREILSAALFQHSSKVQPFKQESLDAIIERILYFSSEEGLSVQQIQDTFEDIIGYCIPISTFESSIERLVKSKTINIDTNHFDLYKISSFKKAEIEAEERVSLKKQEVLIDKVFKNSPENKSLYSEPFWFTISYIFSKIGDYSARIVDGNIDKEQILFPILDSSIAECKKLYQINYDFFKQRIVNFFSEISDPLYNETKCILAQNYFIAKSIGINPNSENFSKEVFENQIIYLDTNVILALVSKNNRKHNNAIAFIKAIKKLNLQICVSSITTNEYESWVQNEFERIRKTVKQIPKQTQSKIESPVYKDYYQSFIEESNKGTEVALDDILLKLEKEYFNYKNILTDLISKDNLVFIDDIWFENIEKDSQFDYFVKYVKSKYSEVSTREKGEGAAIHDAKLLLWIDKKSKESGINHLFVTTDTSMPLIKLGSNEKTNNIILEAILQWLLPLTNGSMGNDINATIAEIIKQKILPKEFIFEIKDFLIFDQLHMECQELPSEDVENCIIYLKKNATGLNPNNAADREKFASEIAKYFIDPGKKFKLELSQKEKENENLKMQLGDVFNLLEGIQEQNKEKDKALNELKIQHNEEVKNITDGHSQEISDIKGALSGVTEELMQMKKEQKRIESVKSFSSWQRPSKISFLLFLLLVAFGILQLLPKWKYNFPAMLIEYINLLKPVNEAKFRLWLSLDGFFTSSLIVTLFIFSYQRLFNKEKKDNKKKELGL